MAQKTIEQEKASRSLFHLDMLYINIQNPVLSCEFCSLDWTVSQSVRKSPLEVSWNLMGEPQSSPVIFGFLQLVLLRTQPNVAFPLLIRQLPSFLTHIHEV